MARSAPKWKSCAVDFIWVELSKGLEIFLRPLCFRLDGPSPKLGAFAAQIGPLDRFSAAAIAAADAAHLSKGLEIFLRPLCFRLDGPSPKLA
jgi:hypothetical protein